MARAPRRPANRVATLLIDLGGVVVHDPRPFVVDRLVGGRSAEKPRMQEEYYRLSRALDRGSLDLRAVHRHLRRRFPWVADYSTFRRLVCDRSLRPIPPVLRALRRLKRDGRVRVVLASNVSRPVWRGLEKKWRLSAASDAAVLSFRLGSLKPSATFLRAMLVAARAPRGSVLFLDDTPANVEAARKAGVPTYRVANARETMRVLRGLIRSPPATRPIRRSHDRHAKAS